MADENTIDYPALCEELSARVESLEAQLAEEQDKNAVLVQQVVEAEDNIANREVESFAEVIDPEDKDYWRERMIENREADHNWPAEAKPLDCCCGLKNV